jgi:predicted nucleotidyltransferase
VATDLGPALIAFGGVAAGSIASYFGTRSTLRAASQTAREQRSHDQAMANATRAAEEDRERLSYEVDTLLELQIVVHRMIRVAGKLFSWHLDTSMYTPGTYPVEWLERRGRLLRRLLAADAAIVLLGSRVRDEEVRLAVEQGRTDSNRLRFVTGDIDKAMDISEEARRSLSDAQARIGELLRTLPPPTSFRPVVSEMWDDDPED